LISAEDLDESLVFGSSEVCHLGKVALQICSWTKRSVSASFLALHRFLRTGGLEMVLRWRCSHCGRWMAQGATHAAFLLAHWWVCYACDDLVAVYERSCGGALSIAPKQCAQRCPRPCTQQTQVVRSEVRSTEDSPSSALSGACSSVLSRMLSNCAKLVRSDICFGRVWHGGALSKLSVSWLSSAEVAERAEEWRCCRPSLRFIS